MMALAPDTRPLWEVILASAPLPDLGTPSYAELPPLSLADRIALSADRKRDERTQQTTRRIRDRETHRRAKILAGPDSLDAQIASSQDPCIRFEQFHDRRRVDGLGAPDLTEQFLNWLCPPARGERPPIPVVLQASVMLQSHNIDWYRSLLAYSELYATERSVAAALETPKSTVHHWIVNGRAFMQETIADLYAALPGDE